MVLTNFRFLFNEPIISGSVLFSEKLKKQKNFESLKYSKVLNKSSNGFFEQRVVYIKQLLCYDLLASSYCSPVL